MIATLPAYLSHVIAAEITSFPAAALRAAADALSRSYRGEQAVRAALSPAERAAYLAVRLPSTFAVAEAVWRELAEVIPTARIRSILDAGAGPGTASLAAHALAEAGTEYTALERDEGWRDVAQRLAAACGLKHRFRHGALAPDMRLEPHDVAIASYALGELPANERERVVAALWRAARHALVIIEPGTPKGFMLVRVARAAIMAEGGHAAAPCTHDAPCPMSERDWCHRPVRVARSPPHRAAKQAQLAHEDEKFSFVILMRERPARPASARIVRKPIRNTGHVHLDLCTAGALERLTVARSDGDLYRLARDAEWGKAWPPYDG